MNDLKLSGPVLTALDMPVASPGGSIELLYDLYTGTTPLIDATVFMLAGDPPPPRLPTGVRVVEASGKCLDGAPFWAYVDRLRDALAGAVDRDTVEIVHLQHLAFGAAPALLGLLPDHPALALVHGTDLIFAATHPTQHRVLADTVAASRAIVAPTAAMADLLIALHEPARQARIIHLPWGIPDELIHTPPLPPRDPDGTLRVLYAGRLTQEKGFDSVYRIITAVDGMHLSIAAPPRQYSAHPIYRERSSYPHTYLGWLPRRRLWQTFADHDLLIVPSTTLEAFGLTPLEAQACGLPVLYQPVPGLQEVLGDSALSSVADASTLTRVLRDLRTDPTILDDLRAAGRRNAGRFPLSATAAALHKLGQDI
ncbi:glycosyltransferase family 4 protein [Nonomuraea sp. NPDC005650]|uniref:glycosyltransferase family 4 protein n=1 Tax=Nonomuraea sp. NPDC005650 TaxID=3157045 RepID=UPI0033A82022